MSEPTPQARTASRRRRACAFASANAAIADLEHAQRDRRQRERDTSTRIPGGRERAGPRGAGLVRLRPPATRGGRGGHAEPARGLERDAGQEPTSGEIAAAMPAASSGPTTKRARAAGRRARTRCRAARGRRGSGSSVRSEEEIGGTHIPPTNASTASSARPRRTPRPRSADAGHRGEHRRRSSTLVCPTRSITRPEHRRRDTDADARGGGDDPDLRIVEALRRAAAESRSRMDMPYGSRATKAASISGATPGMRSSSR